MEPKRKNIDMELIKRMYVDEKKSLAICGEILGHSGTTIKRRLIEMNCKIRKRWEWGIGRERTEEEKRKISLGHVGVVTKRKNVNMELLKTLYVNEQKSLRQCADELKCSVKVVRARLIEMNCKIRTLWPVGLKLSEEHRRKISDKNKGYICSKESKRKISEALKGRRNYWMDQKGEKNPNWNGGYSLSWFEDPVIKKCYNIVRLAKKREQIIKQKCEICELNGMAHHDDYKKPLEIRWLCRRHHTLFHREHIMQDYKYIKLKEAGGCPHVHQ